MLTVPEAAKRVGRNPETVRRWIRSGRLRSQKVGTQHLIDEQDLDAVLDEADMLPLPTELRLMEDGRPQLNWVAILHRQRQSH
ncbi:MAG: helix-turn-helix domain-containing protein [Gaiellaceae bacterium]